MGGGNAQKSATARARNLEKAARANKGSQNAANAAALTLKCSVCLTQFLCTSKEQVLKEHVENKHPKHTFDQAFPTYTKPA